MKFEWKIKIYINILIWVCRGLLARMALLHNFVLFQLLTFST